MAHFFGVFAYCVMHCFHLYLERHENRKDDSGFKDAAANIGFDSCECKNFYCLGYELDYQRDCDSSECSQSRKGN